MRRTLLVSVLILLATVQPTPIGPASVDAAPNKSIPAIAGIDAPAVVTPLAGAQRAIPVTIEAIDEDGWQDIASVTVDLLRPDGAAHRATIGASAGDGDGTARIFTTSFAMQYHDPPATEANGYRIRAVATDSAGQVSAALEVRFGYTELAALTFSEDTVSFGSLLPGGRSDSVPLSVKNRGNVPIDLRISGTDLVHQRGARITVDHVRFDVGGNGSALARTLSAAAETIGGFDLAPSPEAARETWWALETPTANDGYVPSGAYRGTITMSAIVDDRHGLLPACSDGEDNDGDGLADFPLDPGCLLPTDDDEAHELAPECVAPGALPAMPADPGFAYEDADGDLAFNETHDVAIAMADIVDGMYEVPPERPGNALVIPPSVGPLDVPGAAVRFASGDQAALYLTVNVSSTESVTLMGGTEVVAPNVALAARDGDITLSAHDRVLAPGANLTGATSLVADTDALHLDGSRVDMAGAIEWQVRTLSLVGADVRADQTFTLTATGALAAPCTTVTGVAGVSVTTEMAPIDVRMATVSSDGPVAFRSSGNIEAARASIGAGDGLTFVAPIRLHMVLANMGAGAGVVSAETGDLFAAEATLRGAEGIETAVGRLDVRHGAWSTEGGAVAVSATGPGFGHGADLRAIGEFDLVVGGEWLGPNVTLASTGRAIMLHAAGPMDVSGGLVDGARGIDLTSVGDMRLERAVLQSGREASVDVGKASATVYVEGLAVRDKDARLVVGPSGVTVAGTPSEGEVSA